MTSALTIKALLGTAAVWGVLIVAAGERGGKRPEPTAPPAVPFAERYPIIIYEPQIVDPEPKVEVAALAPAIIEKPEAKPVRKVARFHCRRIYYTLRGHRYWRCKR